MNKNTIKSFPVVFVSYFVILLLVYAAALYVSYAFFDDYSILDKAQQNAWFGEILKVVCLDANTPVTKKVLGEFDHDISNGRPFMGAYIYIAFKFFVHTIAALAWLRLFALIGLVLFASLLFRWLKSHHWPSYAAFAIPCCMACSPPFIVYVVWATCSFFPFAAFLAGLSYVCLDRWRKDNQWFWLMLSILFLWLSLGIYQPVAMMFWLFAAVRWLSFARFDQSALKAIAMDAAVAFLAIALAYLAFVQALPHLLDVAPSSRSALVSEPLHKLWWFMNGPLLMSAHSWFVLKPNPWLATLLLLFIFSGLWLKSSGVRDALLRTVLWIGLLLVSALPSLVVDFNDGSYRQYAALTALLLLGLGHALSQLNHRKRFLACRRRFALERWAMACLVIYSTLMASYRTLHYFVVPQIREQELITAALREAHAQDATHLYIKAAPMSLVQNPREEFGFLLSLYDPEHLWSMISFLWKEQYPHKPIHIHVDPSPLKVIDYQVRSGYEPSVDIEPLPDHAPANSVLIDANKIIGEAAKM